MPIQKYGVLRGTVVGHKRDADDDHYQVLVQAKNTLYRIAINVKSNSKAAPSTLYFQRVTKLPADFVSKLEKVAEGYTALPSKPGGLAFDYLRTGIVKPKSMTLVPPDSAGEDNDLKDKLEKGILDAMRNDDATVIAFGQRWGPEATKPDQYFKFKPGNGIHDIHMNQGSTDSHKSSNGTWQDGCLFMHYPNEDGDTWNGFFFAFQSQSFQTDDRGNATGQTLVGATPAATGTSKPKPPAKPKPSAGKPKPKKKPKGKGKRMRGGRG